MIKNIETCKSYSKIVWAIMKIDYYSVFEAYKAHRLLERLDGKPRMRDHVYGKLQFNITRDESRLSKTIWHWLYDFRTLINKFLYLKNEISIRPLNGKGKDELVTLN